MERKTSIKVPMNDAANKRNHTQMKKINRTAATPLNIPTVFGTFKAAVTQKGILRLEFPDKSYEAYKKNAANNETPPSGRTARLITKQLKNYFSGEKVTFTVPIDLDGMTPFGKKVLKELAKIPHGSVVTYKQLARKIGGEKYARAVGNALGRNPVPVILPCHRVVRSDKTLGGFSGGLHWKKILLSLENIKEFT